MASHEFIWLNQNRQYVLLNTGTWHDASTVFSYDHGQRFLNGKIERILPYQDYVEEFPEVKKQEPRSLGDFANRLFVRTVIDGSVIYNHNEKRMSLNMDSDISD
jgi:hypothetical protein